jgi:hypothetical protein
LDIPLMVGLGSASMAGLSERSDANEWVL